jgi:hypothetical protein
MNQNSPLSNLLPKILLGLALVGFLILWLLFAKGGNSLNHLTYSYKVYPTAIGFFLMIPYLIYLLGSKSKPRKKLQGNRNDSTEASATHKREK